MVREKAYAKQQEAEVAIANANMAISQLQSQLKKTPYTRSSTPQDTLSSAGVVSAHTQCRVVLKEALGRYQEVAKEADRLVERLRVSQGWGQMVMSASRKE